MGGGESFFLNGVGEREREKNYRNGVWESVEREREIGWEEKREMICWVDECISLCVYITSWYNAFLKKNEESTCLVSAFFQRDFAEILKWIFTDLQKKRQKI